MPKEEIVKIIEILDKQIESDGVTTSSLFPPIQLLIDLREFWKDKLLHKYGISHSNSRP